MWVEQLTRAQFRLYVEQCLRGGERRVEAHVLTYDGDFVRDITDLLDEGGDITGDTTRDVLQVATLILSDPGNTISFDHPGSVPVSRRRLIRIIDSRRVPGLGWVDCVVHTGPIWTPTREGDTIRLVVHDGSRLAMGTVRRRRSWQRKARITSVIIDLLSLAGASSDQIRVPQLRPTLAKIIRVGHRPKKKRDGKKGEKKQRRKVRKFTADTEDTYWAEAQHLAPSLNRRLYADPRLIFRLKPRSNQPSLTIDRGDLLAEPSINRPEDGPHPNVFEVLGRDPKGKKRHRPSATAVLPAAHEESRESLAWHGKNTENRVKTVDDHLKSKAACKKRATKDRDEALRLPQEREIVIPTMPFLQAWDIVNVREVGTAQMRQWRLPLSGAEGMTIGSTARVPAHYRRTRG